MLRENKITEAQTAKEDIEAAQRRDAKLRETNKDKWAWNIFLMIRIIFIPNNSDIFIPNDSDIFIPNDSDIFILN